MMKALILSAHLFTAAYHPAKHFANTNWVSKVDDRCTESINLLGNSYAIRYSKKAAQTYRGCYSVSKDTLIIKERDDSRSTVSYHKIKFLLIGHELHFYSNEELVNHKWTRFKTDQKTVFTRV